MNNTAENDFWISQGKVATSDRWGGQKCKIFMWNFSGFNVPKIVKIGYFWRSYSINKKGLRFFGTQCIIWLTATTLPQHNHRQFARASTQINSQIIILNHILGVGICIAGCVWEPVHSAVDAERVVKSRTWNNYRMCFEVLWSHNTKLCEYTKRNNVEV